MKIKCIESYYDLQLKKTINVNEVLEVDEARGKALTTVNNAAKRILAIEVPTPTTEKVGTTKKRTKKDV